MRLLRRGEQASTLDLLVAGLGNPGREYERTRHNIGRLVADELARRHGGSFRSKFSGRSLAAAARFFKVEPSALVVVHDDVDLDAGRLQARLGGGLAGHNGLRSI